MSLHPTLARQVRKAFGETQPAGLDDLLAAISQTYEGFDQDHTLIERSMEISSEELGSRIKQLREAQTQLEEQKASVERTVDQRTHELGEAQAELEASIRALPFGFALINPQEQFVFHNEALEELVGFQIPKVVNESAESYKQLVDYFAPAINLLDEVKRIIAERVRLEKQIALGASFFRIIALPVLAPDAESQPALGVVLIVENITDAKAAERSRDEFFSIASHELRTPLTAIKGNSAMILDFYADTIKDADLHQMVEDMHESSIRLIGIVNDFLSASRLEQGKMGFKMAPVDLYELTANILHEYTPVATKAGVTLVCEEPTTKPVTVLADSDRTQQIIVNLLSNALKFTPQGTVTIKLVVSGNTTQLSVTDTGRGIPMESQHLLFRKFQQATNNILTRDTTKGTGLGLYISQLMAENMGGRLFLGHTEIDHGSTFVLELPTQTSKPNV